MRPRDLRAEGVDPGALIACANGGCSSDQISPNGCRLQPSGENQNQQDDQDNADHADAAMAEAVAIAAEAAAESAEQKYDQYDDENESERHGASA